MKLRAALMVMAVILTGLAAWSQEDPKAEISIDYSHARFAAFDYATTHYEFYRAYDLNGGGGSVVWHFSRLFGLKAELQGYASRSRELTLPPVTHLFPKARWPASRGTCSPTCLVRKSGNDMGFSPGRRRAVYSLENLKAFSAPASAADLRGLIAQSIVELRTGTLDPKLANSISYLGACFLRALEMSDLEARLQALEAHAEKEGDGEPQR